MLVLGLQVLLGFNFQLFLLPHYDRLGAVERSMTVAALVTLLVAMVVVLVPTAHHRIVDGGEDTPSLDTVTTWAINLSLFPLAAALGGDFFLIGARIAGAPLGAVLAAGTFVCAMVAWYVVPFEQRRRPRRTEPVMEKTNIEDKIAHVLTETRVVLPGTQALLGFQLAGVFQFGFDALSPVAKAIHLVGFVFLAVSVIVLLLPAAYHRIAEHGDSTERLHHVTSVCIVLAMLNLACAIACDVYVVVERTTGRSSAAIAGALVWLAVSLGAWIFGMVVARALRERRGAESAAAQA